jgi:hypothetical protein
MFKKVSSEAAGEENTGGVPAFYSPSPEPAKTGFFPLVR